MNPYIKESVNLFLGWKLPTDFYPDAGITFKRHVNAECSLEFQYTHEPTGTNLFNDPQATAMLTYAAKPLIDRIAELELKLTTCEQLLRATCNYQKSSKHPLIL